MDNIYFAAAFAGPSRYARNGVNSVSSSITLNTSFSPSVDMMYVFSAVGIVGMKQPLAVYPFTVWSLTSVLVGITLFSPIVNVFSPAVSILILYGVFAAMASAFLNLASVPSQFSIISSFEPSGLTLAKGK